MKLRTIFQNHAVLQRGKKIAFFGEGAGTIRIELQGKTISKTQKSDTWCVLFPKCEAGGPFSLTVTCNGERTVYDDIYIGDVFFLGGQSNMQFRLCEQETKLKENPKNVVRAFFQPMVDVDWGNEKDGTWLDVNNENERSLSAIGAFLGSELAKEHNVPIGLICCAQGASTIEAWTDREVLAKKQLIKPFFERNTDVYSYAPFNAPGYLYEKTLKLILPYTVNALVWYQGESNTRISEANDYFELLLTFVPWIRKQFCNQKLPVILTEICPYEQELHQGCWFSVIREAIAEVPKYLENVASVSTADQIKDVRNIHPHNKEIVAHRLFLAIENLVYGQPTEYHGPLFEGLAYEDGKTVLYFSHTGTKMKEEEPLNLKIHRNEFLLDAEYEIKGNTIVISNAKPYDFISLGYENNGYIPLYNEEKLPASPFLEMV